MDNKNDIIFLTRASLPSFEEYIEEIRPLWNTHWITTFGVKHQMLEDSLREYLDCPHISLFTNGHTSLEMSLMAMELTGEIITTPFTFASTTNAITRNNLTPVFCDILPDTLTIDPSKIESLITSKTSAILAVHVYGNVCEIEELERIAQKHQVKIIYDAAHAFGVSYKGKNISVFGDVSIFSFHASKVFNTAEGGAVCWHDSEFGERLLCIRNFGLQNEDDYFASGNGKMNELSAALGLCNLRHISDNINKRKRITALYKEYLCSVKGLSFQTIQKNITPNYAYFPVRIDPKKFPVSRDALYDKLQQKGIFCQKQFGVLTSSFSCNKKYNPGNTPVAETAAEQILLLPLFSDMSEKQVEYIAQTIISSVKK